jgi:hypothetical protein
MISRISKSPSKVASHLGWQAACLELLPTRRDAGQWPLLPNPDCVTEKSGQATLVHEDYLLKPAIWESSP